VQLLSQGRFRLGLGSGENLNEHVVGGGWPVNSELPGPGGFAGATQFVRPEDVTGSIPCGDDVDSVVDAVRPFVEAGFTEVALVQIGGDHQEPYLEWAERKLLPALRDL
jgi:hypothetical protein